MEAEEILTSCSLATKEEWLSHGSELVDKRAHWPRGIYDHPNWRKCMYSLIVTAPDNQSALKAPMHMIRESYSAVVVT